MTQDRVAQLDEVLSRLTESVRFRSDYEDAVDYYGTEDLCALVDLDDLGCTFAPREGVLTIGSAYLDAVEDPELTEMLSVPAAKTAPLLPLERAIWLVAQGSQDGCLVKVNLIFNGSREIGSA